MITYTLKRKTYSDNEGMSTGKKVALGVGATLGATALGIAGARRGVFGAKAALGTNKAWMKAGKALRSDSMMLSGAEKYGKAKANQVNNKLVSKFGKGLTDQQSTSIANRVGDRALTGILKG